MLVCCFYALVPIKDAWKNWRIFIKLGTSIMLSDAFQSAGFIVQNLKFVFEIRFEQQRYIASPYPLSAKSHVMLGVSWFEFLSWFCAFLLPEITSLQADVIHIVQRRVQDEFYYSSGQRRFGIEFFIAFVSHMWLILEQYVVKWTKNNFSKSLLLEFITTVQSVIR